MKILIACEESQTVCKEMRMQGHECYSCDIIECSGGHPEWHIMQDVIPLLNGNCKFKTMDGIEHIIEGKWDMIIEHPPMYLSYIAGNKWYKPEFAERFPNRLVQRHFRELPKPRQNSGQENHYESVIVNGNQ